MKVSIHGCDRVQHPSPVLEHFSIKSFHKSFYKCSYIDILLHLLRYGVENINE